MPCLSKVKVPVIRTLTLLDQAVVTATSGLLVLTAVRQLNLADFGLFVLAYTALGAWIAIQRNSISLHLVIANTGASDLPRLIRRTLLLSPAVVATTCAIAFLPSRQLPAPVLFVILTIPIVMLQDLFRYASILQGKIRDSLRANSIWLTFALLGYGASTLRPSDFKFVTLAWSLGACMSFAYLYSRFHSKWDFDCRATEDSSQLGSRLDLVIVLTGVIYPCAILLYSWLISFLAGPDTLATLGAAAQIYVPITVVVSALPLLLRRFQAPARSLTAVLAVVSALSLISLWMLPSTIGKFLLADSWDVVHPILPLMAMNQFLFGLLVMSTLEIQMRGSADRALRLVTVQSALLIVSALTISALHGTSSDYLIASISAFSATFVYGRIALRRISLPEFG